ncbi:sugar kinase [uncultured Jannaschia sp.]|uniref:tagatose kinase n=1 Tax=uncultured Jannaschia sp. TaxID=293347 RepID=UPI002635A50E|nr:sugar kinase [uncultured Jannaschia sp.]
MTRALAPDALGPTICAGEILVELVASRPGAGFREVLDLTGPYPSGAPAIFIDQCARLGGQAAMIGAVGDDDFGAVNLDRLRQDGADLSGVAVDPDRPTGSAFVRYRPDGARDFVYNIAHSAAARFGWSDAVEALVRRAGHLHVMGTALSMQAARDVIVRAADIVLGRGGSLSVDPNLRKEIAHDAETEALFADLVDRAALCLPSGEELSRAAGIAMPEAAVAALHARGVGEVVLKRGAGGATLFLPGGIRHDAAAFAVPEVDPTGAGDCFGAAYLTCRRLGMAPKRALDYACAAGACNVAVRGPMEGAATRAELDAFIAGTPRRAS